MSGPNYRQFCEFLLMEYLTYRFQVARDHDLLGDLDTIRESALAVEYWTAVLDLDYDQFMENWRETGDLCARLGEVLDE